MEAWVFFIRDKAFAAGVRVLKQALEGVGWAEAQGGAPEFLGGNSEDIFCTLRAFQATS